MDIPELNIEVIAELVECCGARNDVLGFAPSKSPESVLEAG